MAGLGRDDPDVTAPTDPESGFADVELSARDTTSNHEKAAGHSETKRNAGWSKNSWAVFVASFLVGISVGWAIVVTVRYVELKDDPASHCVSSSSTVPRSNDLLGVAALSHINVVVDDVEEAAVYYQSILGFAPASNADGPMYYQNITLESFCLDAGFEDGLCRVDIMFLKHTTTNIYLELFNYYSPVGNLTYPENRPNDRGGPRHIALEVLNSTETYFNLQKMDHQGEFITKLTDGPLELTPFPYFFFYWRDRYGVIWEFEQGRPVEYYTVAGITG